MPAVALSPLRRLWPVLVRNGAGAFGFTRASQRRKVSGDLGVVGTNVRRFNAAGQLVVEGTTVNRQITADYPGGTGWTLNNVTASATTAPDGTSTAGALIETATTSQHSISPATVAWASDEIGKLATYSFVVEADTAPAVQIAFTGSVFGGSAWANYDLVAGVVGSKGSAATARMSAYSPGRYLCQITLSILVAGTPSCFISFADSASAGRLPSHLGSSRRMRVMFFQAELGAFATSHVPAVGSINEAAPDTPLWIFPAGFGARGTIIFRANLGYNAPAAFTQGLMNISDGSDNNRLWLENPAGGASIVARGTRGGTDLGSIALGNMTAGTDIVLGLSWNPQGFAAAMLGGNSGALTPAGGVSGALSRALAGHASVGLTQPANGGLGPGVAIPADFTAGALMSMLSGGVVS